MCHRSLGWPFCIRDSAWDLQHMLCGACRSYSTPQPLAVSPRTLPSTPTLTGLALCRGMPVQTWYVACCSEPLVFAVDVVAPTLTQLASCRGMLGPTWYVACQFHPLVFASEVVDSALTCTLADLQACFECVSYVRVTWQCRTDCVADAQPPLDL